MNNLTINRRSLAAMMAVQGTYRAPDTQKTEGHCQGQRSQGVGTARAVNNTRSFADVLSIAANVESGASLKISKHAENRLRDRNINLSDGQRDKIAVALEKAERKGVREALVMLDGFALVANAASKTVITAVGESDLRQNIFTNIDGAVFA